MALENLKQNIEFEKELIKEILIFNYQASNLEESLEKELLIKYLISAVKKLRIINNSIPAILNAISPFRKLKESEEKVRNLVKISYVPEEGEERISITVEHKDRDTFLKELSLSKETLKRLKRKVKKKKGGIVEYRKPNWYAKISNKLFLKWSTKFSERGELKRLNSNLRKANLSYLVTTYLSMILFSTLAAFVLGIISFVILLFFTTGLINILRNVLIIFLPPLVTFFFMYFYPYLEGKSIERKIELELPFVAIHMSAIAGSGIEPTQIFKIIALGQEYKQTKNEFKKIVNQVNVYGYDLITALKNTARETSSKRLSELLNGMATTISGGGSLSEFLDKRADSLLFKYRLEREKKTKSAETFMDIYISIVIAAPMIMTLLLILIFVSGMDIGLSLSQLTIIILSIVSMINVIFLVFLHLSQPGY